MIAFAHTLLHNSRRTKINTCLVVCPLNTVLNWHNEWMKWVPSRIRPEVYEMAQVKKDMYSRCDRVNEWHCEGGVLIMGYEMYRNLSSHRNVKQKSQRDILTRCLIDPGPDVIICDEGHVLKNEKTALSKAMSKIKTKRRVVLTGTPLQNNLAECKPQSSFAQSFSSCTYIM